MHNELKLNFIAEKNLSDSEVTQFTLLARRQMNVLKQLDIVQLMK